MAKRASREGWTKGENGNDRTGFGWQPKRRRPEDKVAAGEEDESEANQPFSNQVWSKRGAGMQSKFPR